MFDGLQGHLAGRLTIVVEEGEDVREEAGVVVVTVGQAGYEETEHGAGPGPNRPVLVLADFGERVHADPCLRIVEGRNRQDVLLPESHKVLNRVRSGSPDLGPVGYAGSGLEKGQRRHPDLGVTAAKVGDGRPRDRSGEHHRPLFPLWNPHDVDQEQTSGALQLGVRVSQLALQYQDQVGKVGVQMLEGPVPHRGLQQSGDQITKHQTNFLRGLHHGNLAAVVNKAGLILPRGGDAPLVAFVPLQVVDENLRLLVVKGRRVPGQNCGQEVGNVLGNIGGVEDEDFGALNGKVAALFGRVGETLEEAVCRAVKEELELSPEIVLLRHIGDATQLSDAVSGLVLVDVVVPIGLRRLQRLVGFVLQELAHQAAPGLLPGSPVRGVLARSHV
mmetsp:Transcript_1309/g.2257  ORF Transcript_1309/g.2257 Transcript_1309/m.2257 type:complete len:388 (+) Transcript_1309:2241-3404(+)